MSNNKNMTEKRRLNVIVMGDMGVGKTSLLRRFTENTFKKNINVTTLIDALHAKININNEKADLQLWDTSGNENFRQLFKIYLRQVDGALLVYDITYPQTFTNLPRWLSLLRAVNETAPVIIVGNKIDKEDSRERVTAEVVKEFADKIKLDFLEASAKTGENVEKIFQSITQKILSSGIENLKEEEGDSKSTISEGKITLSEDKITLSEDKITLSEGESMQEPKKECCSLF